MRTRIKICGFTRVEDAVTAARLGVDAVGLVFYPPSPRNVEIQQAIKIARALPAFTSAVALFVDADARAIETVLQRVAIDLIQFHGDETAEFCRSFNKPYIKAIRVRRGLDVTELAERYHDAAGLLLDAYHPDAKGGTGCAFDWDLIPDACPLPIILAGGLGPENARLAVQSVRPYAVDVSSGVEAGKGIKDAGKMAAFVREVEQGDRNQ